MPQQSDNLKLTGKDLIGVGIFSAIYFAVSFLGMLLGIIPLLWILMPGAVAVLAGVPFMLLCSRVRKPGAVLLMGLIASLLYYATGQFTLVILSTFFIGSVLSEVARRITKYGSFKGNTAAFILFSYGMTGSPLPIWLFRDKFFNQIIDQGIPAEYIETLRDVSAAPMLLVLLLAPIAGGLAGAFIAKLIFKKHFVKAGMV